MQIFSIELVMNKSLFDDFSGHQHNQRKKQAKNIQITELY